jgi:succinoglycan biosynthesis transport protein ExoP
MSGSDHLVRAPAVRSLRNSEQHGAPDQSSDEWTGAEDESLDLWGFLRRNVILIAGFSLLGAVAGVIVTKRTTPTYASTAAIRIDQKAARLPALEALGLSQDNAVATELEMLRSRVLAEEVADSLGLQLVVERPAAVRRARIFSRVSVKRSAVPAEYRLVAQRPGEFALLDRSTDSRLRVIKPGERFDSAGVAFEIAESALKHSPVDFQVLPFDDAVDRLKARLQISRRNRDAEIIDVVYRGTDAQLSSEIVNLLARRFVGGRQSVLQAEARVRVEFLGDQIARVSDQLRDAERALQDFRESERVVSLAEEAKTGVSRRAELQAQRNALEAERSALRVLLAAARTRSVGSASASYRELLAFPTLLRSGMAAAVLGSLTSAEERRSVLLERRTLADPEVQALNARIAQIHGQIESLVATYLQGLTNQVAALDTVLAQSDANLQSMPTKELRLAELERNAKGSEAIYSMLQSRLQEARIAAAASDLSVRLVDPAVVPRKPVSPRPLLSLAVALVAGLVLGVAVAFARELADRSVHTRRDLAAMVRAPVVGMIPRTAAPRTRLLERITGGKDGAADAVVVNEAFSWLATNLAFLPKEPTSQVLVITSALPGDGKTTVATNLAMTLARNGRRVLLVDADLRGGRIASGLGLARGPGLAEVLAGRVERELAVTRMRLPEGLELHVMVAGSPAGSPAHLLASHHLGELIEWARPRYDLTIIDTAPVSAAADAALVASQSEGVIVVVRAGVTERGAVEFAMEQLAMAQAPIAGTVLNDVDLRRAGEYDRALRYYGRYGTVRG